MSVIAHLRIPSESFELGRILELESGTVLELETLVPLGKKAVPFFTVLNADKDEFERSRKSRCPTE